jgi:hypothetical protein
MTGFRTSLSKALPRSDGLQPRAERRLLAIGVLRFDLPSRADLPSQRRHDSPAQGNALGTRPKPISLALKRRNSPRHNLGADPGAGARLLQPHRHAPFPRPPAADSSGQDQSSHRSSPSSSATQRPFRCLPSAGLRTGHATADSFSCSVRCLQLQRGLSAVVVCAVLSARLDMHRRLSSLGLGTGHATTD